MKNLVFNQVFISVFVGDLAGGHLSCCRLASVTIFKIAEHGGRQSKWRETMVFLKPIIVVSWILKVHGSSGHHLGSKNLQNKQRTDDGVTAGSPMLKFVRKIESVFFFCQISKRIFFLSLFLSVTFLIYQEGSSIILHFPWEDPPSMGSG